MTALVDILVQANVVTPTQAREAHQQQIIYGDRIGTNLLVQRVVGETTLAQALGALHGVTFAAGAAADSRPTVTRGLHRNHALALRAVPARVDENTAFVFMVDPHDAGARAQLQEQLGKHVEPVVVCEARMWWLLHKFYLFRGGNRSVILDDAEGAPRTRIKKRSETRQQSSLTEEGPPLFDDPTSPMVLPPSAQTWPSWLGPAPSNAITQEAPRTSAFATLEDADLVDELALPVADDPPVIQGVLVEEPRDTSPLSFADAKTLLATAKDRNAIALIVLRSCLSLFERALLLTVQRSVARGWDAVGVEIARHDVDAIRLPLKQSSIFQLARDSRAHFLGPIPREQVNIAFLRLLGGAIPKSALVVPIVVRGAVVNLLYCDNGKGKQVSTDIGEMLIVAQHINRSYEALLNR